MVFEYSLGMPKLVRACFFPPKMGDVQSSFSCLSWVSRGASGCCCVFFCILVHWFSLPHFALACPPHTVTPIISHCKVFETTLFYTFFALFFFKKKPLPRFLVATKNIAIVVSKQQRPNQKNILVQIVFFLFTVSITYVRKSIFP